MKYLVAGLVGLFACFALAGSSSGVTHAGGETRLRVVLSATELDPGAIGHSEFIQRPDRDRFSTEISNVEEIGTGTVKVIQNATVVTEMRGQLLLNSGEDPGQPRGPAAVAEASWSRGTHLSLRLKNLDPSRFRGNDSCEAKGKVGPVASTLTMRGRVAELDLHTNVPDLVPGSGAEIRIRCEFRDAQGQRQRHETRWSGSLVPVAATTGIILEAPIGISLDPVSGLGMGELNLDSRLGDFVPNMEAGDTIEVWNGEGALILSGKLERN